ncbi:MAG: glycosyltransferase family 4 protein [Candidatus Aenigmarchaeota archaeon]|nr:glycosyltransferase family 4 protein [Candidatus Aenigmarchaeota archaeon]MDW8149667.1 glycosyltransferase family 4 protein [Candidatus Aenigmarchaeota archaeon]
MKVYLKFPWKFVDSRYYSNLVNFPPKDIIFFGICKKYDKLLTSQGKLYFYNKFKSIIRNFAKVGFLPNITFSLRKDIDLVHCARCLLLNKFPWVVDVEHYWNFSISDKISFSRLGKYLITKLLRREYCKKILPWTNAARNSIEEVVDDSLIKNKTEVIYPAIPVGKLKTKNSRNLNLLFVGRYFFQKGGLFALEVFRRLKEKYDIKCTLVSLTIPYNIEKKYENVATIYKSVSEYFLFNKIYPSSHIFIYPGFSDTFGFALLEAMSFKIPIVTVDAFARKEIVEDNRNGFVIEMNGEINIYKIGKKEEELIEKMVEKASLLIENSSIRKRMGRFGRKLVESGKFSIKERNKKLRKVYEEAIRC